ncbi:hypothetical protein ACF1GW_35525 [Streptomyces achromogenes]|uniref:hypothetical protein n=1 Tax=Streptomyces achromogenes TaxID=67255 RepID=UPI0037033505
MTRRITAYEVVDDLAAAGHTDSTRGSAWRPGLRAYQASPRTVRIWHDGPDEGQHLIEYLKTLRTLGYYVTPERPKGKRPRLRITCP